MNLLIYLDRGVIASNGVNGSYDNNPKTDHGIQGEFKLSPTRDGMLPAAFMVGLLVSSPIFAECSKKYNALRIMGVGLAIWALAAAGCAASWGFWSILFWRMVVGVGEASFVAMAAPFIDDNAPPARKTLWLASFYLCIPVGFALGYVFGGIVHAVLARPGDWRAAFALEGAAMVPFVLFFLFVRDPVDLHGSKRSAAPKARSRLEVLEDVREVVRHPVYSLTVLGFTFYTAVLGVYGYWGPKAGCAVFALESGRADALFGGVTVLTGVAGTLLGGAVLDRVGSSITNALALCGAATLFSGVLLALAFMFAGSLPLFMAAFAVGELAMFAVQAPGSAVTMWAVPPGSRPLAMSVLIIVIHVLGDVPAQPAVGAMQEALGDWRLTMGIASLFLLGGAALFGASAAVARGAPDYRLQEPVPDGPVGGDPSEGGEDGGGGYAPMAGGEGGGGQEPGEHSALLA